MERQGPLYHRTSGINRNGNNFVYKSSWLWNKFIETESGLDFSSTSCNSLKVRLSQSLVNAQHRHSTDWHNDNFTEFGSIKPWSLIIQHSFWCMSVDDPVPVPVLLVSLSHSPSPPRYFPLYPSPYRASCRPVLFLSPPVPFPFSSFSRPIPVMSLLPIPSLSD